MNFDGSKMKLIEIDDFLIIWKERVGYFKKKMNVLRKGEPRQLTIY